MINCLMYYIYSPKYSFEKHSVRQLWNKITIYMTPFIHKGVKVLCMYKGINTQYCSSASNPAAGNIKCSAPAENIMGCSKGAMLFKFREMTTPN